MVWKKGIIDCVLECGPIPTLKILLKVIKVSNDYIQAPYFLFSILKSI